MNTTYIGRSIGFFLLVFLGVLTVVIFPHQSQARNINSYSDTISDSKPSTYANHTFSFTVQTTVAPSGYFEFVPPADFEITPVSTFGERNVEMYVNGIARAASSVLGPNTDLVTITYGSPGRIRYTLNPTVGITSGSRVELRIGNHTSHALRGGFSYSTTTGTTTIQKDSEPIRNGPVAGTQIIRMDISGGLQEAYAEFNIAIINGISTGKVDTTEKDPPYRFNGKPSGTVGGTTFNVELSLETDERAVCKYSTASGTSYIYMQHRFTTTGLIVHSTLVKVATGTINRYYVRCIDETGDINIDDYVITFLSLPPPVGNPNSTGNVEGNGTGNGNQGSGGGTGNGGSSGGQNGGGGGSGNNNGSSGGASGGGSGGNSGAGNPNQSGGGFESVNGPYRSGDAEVIISGYAFPGSTIYALVDGYQSKTTKVANDGSYSLTISAIARGVYTFGIYAIGSDNIKSSTFSTSFTVTGGRTSNLSNINVMPSITVSPNPVTPGVALIVSGRSIPDAEIIVENQNSKTSVSKKSFTTTSGSDGVWSLTVDTKDFSNGTYKIRAKSKQQAGQLTETNFSDYAFYGVGQSADVPLSADLNRDGKVNLTDFSILLFWWGGNGGDSNPPADINRDGKVNLTDFSILLFNWTG